MESFSLFPRISYFTFISDTEKKEKMSLKDGKLKKFASSKLRRSASQTDGRAKRSLQVEKIPPFFSSLSNKPCRTASWWAGAPSPSPTWWTWWEPPGKMGRRRIVTREFLFSAQAPGLVLVNIINIIWIMNILMIFSSVQSTSTHGQYSGESLTQSVSLTGFNTTIEIILFLLLRLKYFSRLHSWLE